MAARFRKIGVTTVGACAGLGLAGWALNPFDRQYAVRPVHLPSAIILLIHFANF